MEKFTLKVEERKIFGKKAQKLRGEGKILGNIFGRGFKSTALTAALKDFLTLFKKAKKTHLIYLQLGKVELPALIQNVQRHPLNEQILHVDFRRMDLKEKTETAVPVVYSGETEVVKSGEADVLLLADNVMVLCLPTEIPEKISLDISKLKEIGDEIRVKDLPKIKDVEYVDDKDKLILQIAAAQKEEIPTPAPAPVAEEVAPAEEAKKEEAKPEEGKPTEGKGQKEEIRDKK